MVLHIHNHLPLETNRQSNPQADLTSIPCSGSINPGLRIENHVSQCNPAICIHLQGKHSVLLAARDFVATSLLLLLLVLYQVYMSRHFHSHPALHPETSSATPKGSQENEQVAALYELGLLGSGKASRSTRRRVGNENEEKPSSGNGFISKKSTPPVNFPLTFPSRLLAPLLPETNPKFESRTRSCPPLDKNIN